MHPVRKHIPDLLQHIRRHNKCLWEGTQLLQLVGYVVRINWGLWSGLVSIEGTGDILQQTIAQISVLYAHVLTLLDA